MRNKNRGIETYNNQEQEIYLAKQEDDVNKKMIFKWTPGFRLSQSWQTRAAIGSSESYGALPLRGAGSQQSAWAQGGSTPALQAPL